MVEKGKVNPVDIQLVNDVLKRHVKKRERDLGLLYQYAGQFRIQNIVREYMLCAGSNARWQRHVAQRHTADSCQRCQ
jgi:hypothetical protein